jgi:hypothetical protein
MLVGTEAFPLKYLLPVMSRNHETDTDQQNDVRHPVINIIGHNTRQPYDD